MFEILSVCKGGGYHYCRTSPLHPRANSKGLYPLHRVLMENMLGRLLDPDEVVHHKDQNKDNNAGDNLELMIRGEHTAHHRRRENIHCVCPVCGTLFSLKPHLFRLRMKRRKFDAPLCCSRSCGTTDSNRRMKETAAV